MATCQICKGRGAIQDRDELLRFRWKDCPIGCPAERDGDFDKDRAWYDRQVARDRQHEQDGEPFYGTWQVG